MSTDQENLERVNDTADDAIGTWRGVYDATSDDEVEWLLYIADLLEEEEEEESGGN